MSGQGGAVTSLSHSILVQPCQPHPPISLRYLITYVDHGCHIIFRNLILT